MHEWNHNNLIHTSVALKKSADKAKSKWERKIELYVSHLEVDVRHEYIINSIDLHCLFLFWIWIADFI